MAKTRLTKAMREVIVNKVLKATTLRERYEAWRKEAERAIRAELLTLLPEGFSASIKNLPREWFDSMCEMYVGAKMSALATWEDNWQRRDRLSFESFAVPANWSTPYSRTLKCMEPLVEQLNALTDERHRVAAEVTAFLASCRFVEQIEERAPELAKHIPKESKPLLPVANANNMLSALTLAGFDSTERKAA